MERILDNHTDMFSQTIKQMGPPNERLSNYIGVHIADEKPDEYYYKKISIHSRPQY